MEEDLESLYYSVGFNDIPTTQLGALAHTGNLDAIQAALPIDWKIEKKALLHAAIHGRSYEVTKLLIENGAPIDSHSYYIAYRFQSYKIFQLLQDMHPDSKLESKPANNILLDAARSDDIETVEWVLSRGAEVNALDYFYGFLSWTSLHHACQACNYELISMLITHGAAVQQRTDKAETPIMLCVLRSKRNISRTQRKDCVQLLMRHGARLSNQIGWLSRILARQGFKLLLSNHPLK
jgi:hypothetical protein